jgi:hypothetical protein
VPRKRKVNYPVARTSRRPADPAAQSTEPTYQRPTVVAIDLKAGAGRKGIKLGSRVRIIGSGLYSGESAVVESLPGGVIPSALVRTDAGRTRRVRTIDLEPISDEPLADKPETGTPQPSQSPPAEPQE